MTGTTNRKTIVVPCIVISSLYVCGVSSVLFAWLSCRRMSSASVPPSMKKTKVRTRYMIPIRLWSVVVTHDVQPVRSRSTPWATTWGTAGGAVISWVAMRWVGSSGGVQPPGCWPLVDALALALGGDVGLLDRVALAVEPGLELRRASAAVTCATMFAWLRPHSSAHCPRNVVPASLPGILNHVWFV